MDTFDVETQIAAQARCFAEDPCPLYTRGIHDLMAVHGLSVDTLYRLCPSVKVFNDLTQALGQLVLDRQELAANGGRIEPLPAPRVVH
jgi:hypothetical protein